MIPLLEGKGKTSLFDQLRDSNEDELIVFPQSFKHDEDDYDGMSLCFRPIGRHEDECSG